MIYEAERSLIPLKNYEHLTCYGSELWRCLLFHVILICWKIRYNLIPQSPIQVPYPNHRSFRQASIPSFYRLAPNSFGLLFILLQRECVYAWSLDLFHFFDSFFFSFLSPSLSLLLELLHGWHEVLGFIFWSICCYWPNFAWNQARNDYDCVAVLSVVLPVSQHMFRNTHSNSTVCYRSSHYASIVTTPLYFRSLLFLTLTSPEIICNGLYRFLFAPTIGSIRVSLYEPCLISFSL